MKPKTKLIWGIVLLSIGIILLGETTGLFCVDQLFRAIIPLSMIIFGLWLISRRKKPVEHTDQSQFSTPPPPPPVSAFDGGGTQPSPDAAAYSKPAADSQQDSYDSRNYERDRARQEPEHGESGKLKYSKTFGDMFIDFNNVKLQSAEISAGIGDLEIRLNGCKMGEGLSRLIISSFIGDIRIYAPHDLPVFAHCSNFVGDIEIMGKRASGFGNTIDSQTANYEASPQKLYVACNSFIGDIKVLGG